MAELNNCIWKISFETQLRKNGLDVEATLEEMPTFKYCPNCLGNPDCNKYIQMEKPCLKLVGTAK